MIKTVFLLFVCIVGFVCGYPPLSPFYTAPVPVPATAAAASRGYSLRYSGTPYYRPVVNMVPQHAIGVVNVPRPYGIGIPNTGAIIPYGYYNQPVPVAYQYKTPKLEYKPVESHGYQVVY